MEWKNKTVRLGARKARQPQAKAGAHAASKRNQTARPSRRLALWHYCLTTGNVSPVPREPQITVPQRLHFRCAHSRVERDQEQRQKGRRAACAGRCAWILFLT